MFPPVADEMKYGSSGREFLWSPEKKKATGYATGNKRDRKAHDE
jgi:hypothetical protein